MSDDEAELGRFKPSKKPKVPHEPFLNEEILGEAPLISSLHVPDAPMDLKKLRRFLTELKPMVIYLPKMARKDQHQIVRILETVKQHLASSDFSREVVRDFEGIQRAYAETLTHSTPKDQEATLAAIAELEAAIMP